MYSSSFCALVAVLICHSCADPLKFKPHTKDDPKEVWGYVDVRPSAHMFYWLYYTTNFGGYKNNPLVMWIQGGPGGSGTGFGNFEEIGPLDDDLNPRKTTWLQAASLLFVDNPVGAGYSYVDNDKAFTTNVTGIADDMMVLLKSLFTEKSLVDFQKVPFYIFSESYGGKMTAAISQALNKAIASGEIKCNFKGLAMGDSWISPENSTIMWAPYLYTNSLVDQSGLKAINASAMTVVKCIQEGRWADATEAWGQTQEVIEKATNGVNFYNILKWGGTEPSTLFADEKPVTKRMLGRLHEDKLTKLMNGEIREKLQVIPKHVTWGGQSSKVFEYMAEDFMKPVVETVDELIQLTKLKVVVYNAQLDLIVETLGTEQWVYTLDIADDFRKATRTPLLHPVTMLTSGYYKTARNFSFYWLLDAGHMVPYDQGEVALQMLENIIRS